MAQSSGSEVDSKRRSASLATGPSTTEWRRRSLLRVRRPAWADPTVVETVREPASPRS